MNKVKKIKKKGGETVSTKPTCTEAVQLKPLQVVVYKNNFDKAFRAFRALVQKERILSQYKEREHFVKPSAKRRKKRNNANRSRLEQERKDS